MSAPFAVLIVTHEAAGDLPACAAALAKLEPLPAELAIVDCASADGSAEVARRVAPPAIPTQVIPLAENLGFSGGMNCALAATTAPFALTLNADAAPRPDAVAKLLARLEGPSPHRLAAATGRLVRPTPPDTPVTLDACGMRLVRSWRHLDRGSGEPDRGQLARAERVFGATGAATLFRRAALEDVALGGQVFDERYHSFREDAELCFRLRERGWEIVYEPEAVVLHRRRVLPERRSALPPFVNYHSLKNRYLLRLDHQTGGNFVATLPWTLPRDLGALAWVLLRERTSLAAYAWLWRERRALWEHRRAVAARRTAPRGAVERWFATAGEPL